MKNIKLAAILSLMIALSFTAFAQTYNKEAEKAYVNGNNALDQSQFDLALSYFDQAIRLDEKYINAYDQKGLTLRKMGKYQDSVKAYDKSLELDQDDYIAHCGKGITLSNMQKYDEAIEQFDMAIKLKSDFYMAYEYKADTLSVMTKYDEAVAEYKKAIIPDDPQIRIYYKIALTLEKAKKFDEAIDSLDKATLIDSEFSDAFAEKGYILLQLNKTEDALAALKRAMEHGTYDYKINYTMGMIYYNEEDYNKAADYFNNATCLRPEEPEGYYAKGLAFAGKGDTDQAAKQVDYAKRLGLKQETIDSFEKPTVSIKLRIGSNFIVKKGKNIKIDSSDDVVPQIINGRTFLPVRAVIEQLGGTIDYYDIEKSVVIKRGNNFIKLYIGKPEIEINDIYAKSKGGFITKKTDVAPYVENGRTMLPLRVIIENLELKVDWDSATSEITITQ